MSTYEKGQSGNPAGRPQGITALSKQIRRRSGYGQEFLDFLFRVFRNESLSGAAGKGGYSHSQCLEAMEILIDRGYGKAVQFLHLSDDVEQLPVASMDLSVLSDEEVADFRALIDKAKDRQEVIDVQSTEAPPLKKLPAGGE